MLAKLWNMIQDSRLWQLTNLAFTAAAKQPQKGRAWQYRQQETCYRQRCRNCACTNTKSACITVGDVLVRHLHLVCWCKCKNEELPHRCAAAFPPGTGPAHSVGLPESRLEVSRLSQASSLYLASLPHPSPSVRSFPKTSFTQHSWESPVTAAATSAFYNCSFSVMSTAHGESDQTPTEVEG